MDEHFRRMLEPQELSSSSINASFIPSKTFAGARPGYYFSNGVKGVGYYLEKTSGGAKRPTAEENGKLAGGGGKKRKLEVRGGDG